MTKLSPQAMLKDLIQDATLIHQGDLVNHLLKSGIFSYDDITNLSYKDNQPQEIQQWLGVKPYLAYKLDKLGAPVLSNRFGYWWGRIGNPFDFQISEDPFLNEIAESISISLQSLQSIELNDLWGE